jgi:ketosteroid isomerase-like protein
MSQQNVEHYRRQSDAWSRGDRNDYLDLVTPDWEFRSSGAFLGLATVYRGREGALALWDAMRGPWTDFSIRIDRIEDLGDRLLALITFSVTGREGIEASTPWAHVVTYRDGFQTVIENYASWEDAFAAVGLPSRELPSDADG